jgi:hypothetical protein
LFIAVAAPSPATMLALGVFGKTFIFLIGPILAFVFSRRQEIHGFPTPKLIRTGGAIYLAVGIVGGAFSVLVDPENEWSWAALTSFGFPQAIGLGAFLAMAAAALALGFEIQRKSYKECPFCLSRIRREATRCRYCAAEVQLPRASPSDMQRRSAPTLRTRSHAPIASARATRGRRGAPRPPWPSAE